MLKALRWLIAIILVVGVIVLLAPTPSLLVSIWVWAAVINIAYILIRSSIIVTPTAHADVVLFFKRPLRKPFQRFRRKKGDKGKEGDKDKKDEWWVLKNGIHFIWPFVCSVRRVSLELGRTPTLIDETFFSKDSIEVRVKGSVQWIPDASHLSDVFITRSEQAITDGLVDAVKSVLGTIAGLKKARSYVESREAIELLINDALRLDPTSANYPLRGKLGAARFDCCIVEPSAEQTKSIDQAKADQEAEQARKEELRHALDEAEQARKELRHALDEESEPDHKHELSAVEKLYGIDIFRFALADVDFDEKTRNALQLEVQTGLELAAQELRSNATVDRAKKLKDALDLEGREALNAEQVIQGQATKEVRSYEGVGGVGTLLHLGLEGQKPSEGGKGKIVKP